MVMDGTVLLAFAIVHFLECYVLLLLFCQFLHFFCSFFRLHHSTTYVDVAYCYRPRSVVCRSVCLSVTLVSPAKTAALIEMPFGLRTRLGPRNHVLDRGPDPPWKGPILRGERGVPL